jgi:competence protein ComEC
MRKLFLFAVFFALADVFYVCRLPGSAAVIVAAVCALLALAARLLHGRTLRCAAICLAGVAAGLLWCAGYRAAYLGPAERADGKTAEISARVTDWPLKTNYGSSVTADIALEGKNYRSVLYLDESGLKLQPGDEVRMKAETALANGELNGESTYYRSRGVWLTAKARGKANVSHPKPSLRDAPARFGKLLKDKIKEVFPSDASGFVTALLTGDRTGLTDAQKGRLSDAGVYHTVAVSGMHVSILLGVVMLLCGGRKKLATAIGLPVIGFFILMVGSTPSAVRAGCMLAILLLAPLFRRENDPPTSLAAALLFLLLLNPWSVWNVGLQLSFACVAGILLFAGKLYRPISKKVWFQKLSALPALGWLAKTMLAAFCCSIASMAFSLPLSVWHFGVVSLVAPLTNILVLWCISFVFSASLLVSLFALLSAPLAMGPAWLLGGLVRYALFVTGLLSRVPYAAIGVDNPYFLAWFVFFYLCVLAVAALPGRFLRPAVLACLAGTLGLTILLSYLDFHSPDFTFTALDVGQGQCLVWDVKGQTVMIDCGGSDPSEAGDEAARFLQSSGEFCVETLVLTHYDADHAGGVCRLLEKEKVKTLILPSYDDKFGVKNQILQAAKTRGCAVRELKTDETQKISGGSLTLFAPTSGKSENDSGICVLASARKYDILITGDLSEAGEYRLLSLHRLPDAELLVAGHHGAEDSSSQALLDAVRPETVLISVGEDNSFGHPAPETLSRIKKEGAAIYRTDQCGTVTIRG